MTATEWSGRTDGPVLVGRKAECAAIDRLLDDARRGLGGALVLRGEAGIGKSALLDYAVGSASDFAASRVTGVESEIALGFAGVHQLILPFLGGLSDLPDPQQHALESVLGLAVHETPDQLLVFLAVLALLDVAARTGPVVLLIDDAHWLDAESARVLTFVARRLRADPIAMLFAVRDSALADSAPLFEGLPQLEIRGLADDDSRAVVDHLAGGRVDQDVAREVVAQTQGNPLALVEFLNALTDAQLSGDAPLPQPLPISTGLQDQFAARARLLPSDAQTVLLLAAAERIGDPVPLRRAANVLGLAWEEAVAGIEQAGLATFTPMVSFRHPLIRSGVYHGATLFERRRAHRALAEALDAEDDVDRRAWHRAAAASSPDEEVARALELGAERAFERGGIHAAAQFLHRASELTPDPDRRTQRQLETVRLRAAEGDAVRAQPLLDKVFTGLDDRALRAEAQWTQGLIWLNAGRGRDAMRVLARAVASLERYDRGFPLDLLITTEDTALYVGALREGSLTYDVAAAARRLLARAGSLTPTELLVLGIGIALTDGLAEGSPTLRAALSGLRQQVERDGIIGTPSAHERANVLYLLAVNAAAAILDDAAFQAVTRSWVDFGRRARTLTELSIALDLRSVAEILAGRFRAAESATAEAEDILSFVGSRGHIGEPGLGALWLHAYRGDEDQTRVIARQRTRDARDRGSGIDLDHSHYALAVLHLGWGRYAHALQHCRAIDSHDPVSIFALSASLLVEAAVRCDDLATARAAFDRLSERAVASGTEWSEGMLAVSRALLATDPDAEPHYRAAIEHLSRSTAAFDCARTELLFGEWLRRMRRRRDARVPLRSALEFFEDVGARAFADRTQRELTATGEHIRPRSDDARDLLTWRETQIARLVADGRTNAEIASQLFISTSTVEYHLRKVYRKLGVTTRTQLARVELPA